MNEDIRDNAGEPGQTRTPAVVGYRLTVRVERDYEKGGREWTCTSSLDEEFFTSRAALEQCAARGIGGNVYDGEMVFSLCLPDNNEGTVKGAVARMNEAISSWFDNLKKGSSESLGKLEALLAEERAGMRTKENEDGE